MKLIGVCLAGATVITLSLACRNAEAATRTTAWETLVAVDPEVVDDERVGWEERVTLHALTPWQAEEYRRGADPGRLILADGRSLEEYLKARLAPEAGVYVGLTSPCRLFSGEWWPSGAIREVALRGHCGVPEEALSAVLDLRAEPLGVRPPRVKAWARDLPEPAEAVLEAEVDGPWTSLRTTTIVNLCVGEWCDGDLRIRSAGEALLEARVVGYFRPLSAADNPAPIVSFFTEGSSNNFFGTYAGSSVTNGIANSFFGTYAGNSVTSGGGNSFFGRSAGHHNTSGGENSFFGRSAGLSNTTEHKNTFVGAYSNGAGGISNATALGYRAQVSQSNSLVLGSIAGVNDATASVNVGIGTAAPQRQLHLKGGDAVFRETDPNGHTTNYAYDEFGRVKAVGYPDGGTLDRYYSDTDLTAQRGAADVFNSRTSSLPARMKSYATIDGSLEGVEVTGFDGLGRVLMVGVSNGGARDWTRTERDAAGRPWRTSNPRTLTLGSNQDLPTAGGFTRWTTNSYDALDRITRITTQDGQFVETAYSGYAKVATDQVGNKRKVEYDALGRISRAVEPNLSTGSIETGVWSTYYTYDVLDNLTGVNQDGRTRSFAYDSLGRLTSATNPESNTTTYLYDANSNLTRKTDARGVQTNYNNYDALNRPGSISYSDGTPTATFTYDSVAVTNGKGRRTGMSDAASGTKTYHFDTMGRMSKIVRQTSDFTQTGEFVYNKLGGITQSKWPGIYDYGGTPLAIHRSHFRALFRLNQVVYFNRAGDNGNNGNVWEVDDQVDSAHGDMTYEYDWWNRITTFRINGVTNQTFARDRWGNSTAYGLAFGCATNRITTTGYNSYDAAGNQLGLPGFTLQYDGAGRIKTVNNGAGGTYAYDGDGRRVKKVGVGWETFNLFFNGRHAAINNTTEGLRWRHLDHLGNLRLKTDTTGQAVCHYYYKPYARSATRTARRRPTTGSPARSGTRKPAWITSAPGTTAARSAGSRVRTGSADSRTPRRV